MLAHADERHRGAGKLVSLFCGAGGLDLGFEQVGFAVAAAVDLRAPSIDSYNHNRKSLAGHIADVTALSPARLDRLAEHRLAPSGVIGGPPCQGFSNANRNSWSATNPNNQLVDVFLRYVRNLQPRIALIENVQGIMWTGRTDSAPSVADHVARSLRRSPL